MHDTVPIKKATHPDPASFGADNANLPMLRVVLLDDIVGLDLITIEDERNCDVLFSVLNSEFGKNDTRTI